MKTRLAVHNFIKNFLIVISLLALPISTMCYKYMTPNEKYDDVVVIEGKVSNKEIINYYGGKNSTGSNEYAFIVIDNKTTLMSLHKVNYETYLTTEIGENVKLSQKTLVEGNVNKKFILGVLYILHIAELLMIISFFVDSGKAKEFKRRYYEWINQ